MLNLNKKIFTDLSVDKIIPSSDLKPVDFEGRKSHNEGYVNFFFGSGFSWVSWLGYSLIQIKSFKLPNRNVHNFSYSLSLYLFN